MKILITGGTGLIGQKLIEKLFLQGFTDLRVLTRNQKKAQEKLSFPVEIYKWNPSKSFIVPEALEGVDVVVHLAGESVFRGHWTEKKKKEILESRTLSTELLIKGIERAKDKPGKLISASAIGIYGHRGDEVLTEESSFGEGFLVEVCKKWEQKILNGHSLNIKFHILRVGIVLAKAGGALQKMLPVFQAGLGGVLGSGKQYMSWIHIDDLVGQILFLIQNHGKKKFYNAVSPEPVTNQVFTKTLGRVLRRPSLFPVPALGLKILFGEMSDVLLSSQRVFPSHIESEAYSFSFPDLKTALEDVLKHCTEGEKVLIRYQWIDRSVGEVFSFFSNEKNLERITPPSLKFKVLRKSTSQIQEGTLIDYNLSFHGMPIKWQSKITFFKNHERFIDEQVQGPYSKWIHTHDFILIKNGTLVKDQVVYKIPFGTLGRCLADSFIEKNLKSIFDYRRKVIRDIFSPSEDGLVPN